MRPLILCALLLFPVISSVSAAGPSKPRRVRATFVGTIPLLDLERLNGFSIRVGEYTEKFDLDQFRLNRKKGRRAGKVRRNGLAVRARFDLESGGYRVRVRSLRHAAGEPEFSLLLEPLPVISGTPPDHVPVEPETTTPLRPMSDLVSNGYGWPALSFSPENHATESFGIRRGDRAVNFELRDTGGEIRRLSDFLETKPVLLVLGAWTCPIYRGGLPALNELAATPWDADRDLTDMVHIVHVYTVEPHPAGPDKSPYTGTVWPLAYSTVGQARTYADRREHATMTEELLTGEQTLLVDALDSTGMVNPVWDTYGPVPTGTFLIGRDGVVSFVAGRARTAPLKAAIEAQLEMSVSPGSPR